MKNRISCLTSRPASSFKMYLLLALLLTLGVGQMWGTDLYLRGVGTWDANDRTKMTASGSTYSIVVYLAATSYSFKVADSDYNRDNKYEANGTNSTVSLNTAYSTWHDGGKGDLSFTASTAGFYKFEMNTSTEKLTVTKYNPTPSAAAPSAVVSGTNAMFYIMGHPDTKFNVLANTSGTELTSASTGICKGGPNGYSYVNTAKSNLSTYYNITNNPGGWAGESNNYIKSSTGGELFKRDATKTAATTASTTTSVTADVLSISTTCGAATGVLNGTLYIQYYIGTSNSLIPVTYNASTASYASIPAATTARASTYDLTEMANGTYTLKTVLTDGIIYYVADQDNFTVSHPVFDVTIVGGTESSTEAGPSAKGTATVDLPDGKKFTGWSLGDGVTLADGYALTDATIKINANKASTVTATFADRAGVKMYFAKPISKSWSTVYAYAWKSSDVSVKNGNYPGVELSTTETINGITYHVYQYYTEADGIGGAADDPSGQWNRIVFGDNNDARKTGDLTIADGHYYLFNSSTTGSNAAFEAGWYIKGSMNSWSEGATNAIVINSITNTGSVTLNLAKGTQYEFKAYSKVDNEMWTNNTVLKDIKASVAATTMYKESVDPYSMYITPSVTGAYKFTISSANTTTPTIAIDYPNQYVHGSWNDEDTPFDEDGCVDVDLAAGTYTFKIKYNNDTYGCDANMTSTSYDYYFYTNVSKPCTLTVATAGKYNIGWDGTNKKASVVFPADQGKAFFEPESYLYFNMSNNSSWQTDNPAAKFWFKNALTGIDVDAPLCLVGDTLDKWVYYAQVPDNERVGRVQMNRTSSGGAHWNHSLTEFAGDRSNASQNCLVTPSSGWDDIDLTWSTYCPPMSSATLTHDGNTVTYGGNGESSTPYLVATSSSIKVSAASVSALNDANMTAHYQFKKAGSADGDKSATATHTYTASASNGTTEAMTVVAQNYYNSTYGTASPASNAIYYKACTPYSVGHTLVGVTKTAGKTGAAATVHGAVYDATFAASAGYSLPASVTVTIGGTPATVTTDYTWNSSTGALRILANKITGNVVITVHGAAQDLTLTTSGNWSTAANWSPACVPTIEHDVVITKPVTVDVTNARAKSVVIYNDGSTHTGHLDIPAGKELVIAGTLRKTTDGSSYGATAENDVFINSSPSAGLGALVMGSHDGTNKATINFYSKSHGEKNSKASVAQYLGVPYGDATVLSDFYNSWVYKIVLDELGNMGWEKVGGDETLDPFRGYAVFAADAEAAPGHYYWMQGTLVNTDNTSRYIFYYGNPSDETNPNNETLLANSWMAPIKISAFEVEDFYGADATIYIFNAGSLQDWIAAGGKEYDHTDPTPAAGDATPAPGQYSAYTIKSTKYTGDAVIPAMQSFSVFTNGTVVEPDCRLHLNYNRLVYTPAIGNNANPVANRAPRRAVEETDPELMRLFVSAESGYSDKLLILSREGFEQGFENGWDGHKIFGKSFAPQLYAITPGGNMAINCIPTFEGTVLGFKPGTEDTQYTFRFSYDGEEALYLNDLKEQQSTLINGENTYHFFTADDDLEARFVISATPLDAPAVATGVESTVQSTEARKLIIDNKLYIIRNGRIYDATGAIVL